jgi:hypothetical protein
VSRRLWRRYAEGDLEKLRHRLFQTAWWTTNVLLLASIVAVLYAGGWEYSVRRYLDGFSDAIVSDSQSAEYQADAILQWIKNGTTRPEAPNLSALSTRDPQITLNYRQLLSICGSATNAFLNLARSNGLRARRLLLLSENGTAKHVVAEILINGRWVIADPVYHVLLRDAHGNLLTRSELHNPATFAEAIQAIPGYNPEYSYERFAHVRMSKLPLAGDKARWFLDHVFPGWEERIEWSLLLERESFLALTLSLMLMASFFATRLFLGWYADQRLQIPRFHLRARFWRAGATFLHAPEIK